MDFRVLFFSTYETVLSIVFGLITILIVTKILDHMFFQEDSEHALKEGNIALAIFSGSIVLSSLLLIHPSILPSIHALQLMLAGEEQLSLWIFSISFCYFLVFYAITTILSILVLFGGISIYLKITVNVDEIEEIKKNNIAVATLLAITIIGLTLFIRPSVERFVASLVSYDMIEATFDSQQKKTIKTGETAPPPQRILPEDK